MDSVLSSLKNPFNLAKVLWPQVYFYDRQREIIQSVQENIETYVVAGNKLGKDFVSAFIALWFFLTRTPCRIITTSAKDDHLSVLWGEIGWFIRESAYPLDSKQGGPLIIHHQEIKRSMGWGNHRQACPLSYLKGMVANDQSIAAMGGHHADPKVPDGIPHTLLIADECSSVPDEYYKVAIPWARRVLAIGNAWECENFFRKAIEAGDLEAT